MESLVSCLPSEERYRNYRLRCGCASSLTDCNHIKSSNPFQIGRGGVYVGSAVPVSPWGGIVMTGIQLGYCDLILQGPVVARPG